MSENNQQQQQQTDVIPKSEYQALHEKFTQANGKLTDFEKQFEKIQKWGGLEKISADLEAFNLLQQEKVKDNPEDLKVWKQATEQTIRESIQKDVDSWKTRAESAENKYKERVVIDAAFTEAASKLHDSAKEDFKALVRQHGFLDEKDNILFKDSNGKTLYKEGSTTEPLDPKGFVQWAIKNKPHYFNSQTKSGDRENTSNATSVNTNGITVDQYLTMSAADHARLPRDIRANLAKQAMQLHKI